MPYEVAWARQRALRAEILAGQGTEQLALLEHRAVVTFGKREAPGNPDPEVLRARGVDVFKTERGGLATWHGPGQLVGYLLFDCGRRGLGVRRLVERLEDGLIAYLGGLGVIAGRREGYPGVWVGDDKIAALGLHIQRGVTMHGFALNLRLGPEAYPGIIPCGITEGGVASLDRLIPDAPGPQEAAPDVAAAVIAALAQPAP
ncbi:MAG: lipoyl(octanoyl) transferase LipB [Deltaproteobacteria bacterium]|nr:lipoyl(octanoyl) transferase LipB [Deltaproteobacteria bacterium]